MAAGTRYLRPWFFCAALLAASVPADLAAAQTLQLDASRSHAAFEVRILWLIGLYGTFGAVHGTLRVDRASNSASVDATIAANEVHMRSRRYENWTKSAEFFDAAHFPHIHFASNAFPLARLSEGGPIDGVLTIRGISRPATFEIAPPVCAAPLQGTCEVHAEGSIRRSDFGMHSRRGTLSDHVDLSLSILVQAGAAP